MVKCFENLMNIESTPHWSVLRGIHQWWI